MSKDHDESRRYLVAGVGGLAVAVLLTMAYTTLAGRPAAAPQAPTAPTPTRTAPQAPPTPASQPTDLVEGSPVPDFTLPRLGGGTVTLSSLRGKVVVIDFWATWCPPCRAEMPWLVEMAKRLQPKGVAFIAISEDDPPGQVPLVTDFARQVPGLERFAALGDPQIEARYGVDSLPTLFIVDRQGQLVASAVGAAEEARVVAFVEQLAGQ
jgi:thiol-disulfide isomerase/thioredoxin